MRIKKNISFSLSSGCKNGPNKKKKLCSSSLEASYDFTQEDPSSFSISFSFISLGKACGYLLNTSTIAALDLCSNKAEIDRIHIKIDSKTS